MLEEKSEEKKITYKGKLYVKEPYQAGLLERIAVHTAIFAAFMPVAGAAIRGVLKYFNPGEAKVLNKEDVTTDVVSGAVLGAALGVIHYIFRPKIKEKEFTLPEGKESPSELASVFTKVEEPNALPTEHISSAELEDKVEPTPEKER